MPVRYRGQEKSLQEIIRPASQTPRRPPARAGAISPLYRAAGNQEYEPQVVSEKSNGYERGWGFATIEEGGSGSFFLRCGTTVMCYMGFGSTVSRVLAKKSRKSGFRGSAKGICDKTFCRCYAKILRRCVVIVKPTGYRSEQTAKKCAGAPLFANALTGDQAEKDLRQFS